MVAFIPYIGLMVTFIPKIALMATIRVTHTRRRPPGRQDWTAKPWRHGRGRPRQSGPPSEIVDSEVHTAHATGRVTAGRSSRGLLRLVGHHCLGGEEERRDGRGVL